MTSLNTLMAACLLAGAVLAGAPALAGPAAPSGPQPGGGGAFRPHLVFDRDPDACAGFLAAAQGRFDSASFTMDLSNMTWPGLDIEWLFSKGWYATVSPHGAGIRHAVRAADLDGDGEPEGLVVSIFGQGGRDTYDLVRVQRYAAEMNVEPLLHQLGRGVSGIPADRLLTDENRKPGWEVPKVARIGKAFYLLEGTENDFTTLRLFRIPAEGKPSKVCEVAVFPGTSEQPGLPPYTVPTPGDDLMALLEAMVGGPEPSSCGSYNPGYFRLRNARQARIRALVRPWSLTDNMEAWPYAPYNPPEQAAEILEDWGDQSLGNRRLYRRLAPLRTATEKGLAEHYGRTFRMPADAAAVEAARVTDQLVRRHFVFPAGGVPIRASRLEKLSLDGGPLPEIEALLRDDPAQATTTPIRWDDLPGDPPLAFALEHPEVMRRLLAAKARPDDGNAFGKTPLMMAAQFDLRDAARLLIEAGADPNLATVQPGRRTFTCFYLLNVTGRTALMYAAANGGVEMVRLLLSAGADPGRRDSRNWDAAEYVKRNGGLSDRDKAAVLDLLVDGGRR